MRGRLEVNLQDETVWLNRQQLSELFDRDIKTIGKHINNALNEELIDIATRLDEDMRDSESYNMLKLISEYTKALETLDKYDHHEIKKPKGNINKNTIAPSTLVAITLFVAQSNPREKDVVIDLLMNILLDL